MREIVLTSDGRVGGGGGGGGGCVSKDRRPPPSLHLPVGAAVTISSSQSPTYHYHCLNISLLLSPIQCCLKSQNKAMELSRLYDLSLKILINSSLLLASRHKLLIVSPPLQATYHSHVSVTAPHPTPPYYSQILSPHLF